MTVIKQFDEVLLVDGRKGCVVEVLVLRKPLLLMLVLLLLIGILFM